MLFLTVQQSDLTDPGYPLRYFRDDDLEKGDYALKNKAPVTSVLAAICNELANTSLFRAWSL